MRSAGAPDRSDEVLVRAFVEGDERAFDELVLRYQRRVYAICYRYFGNAADAEDAAQEAFLALLRHAATYSGAASFSTWMYRVASNACNDLARKRARRPQLAAVPVEDTADETEDLLSRRELALDLAAALDVLEPELRAVVVAHDVDGIPYADIAARSGVPVGTIKSRIHRAHARLAAEFRAPPSTLPGTPGTPAGAREPSSPQAPPTT